ncbi:unnamed protein product, partial [Rotaria socialis]
TKSSSDNDCFAVFIVECWMLVHSFYSSEFTAFAVAGSKLTQRVRSKAFTCLLRQEVAYFDEPENSSGALCARLSSDAMALQEMSGTRLSIIVETFSMLAFGISLGFYFSWHLTLIVCVVLPIIIAFCVLDIYLQMKVSDATGLALQRASSVRKD